MKNKIRELKNFYILWSTQSLSQLGSTITSFALTLWLYQKTGSALQTALLSICSYAPLWSIRFVSHIWRARIIACFYPASDKKREVERLWLFSCSVLWAVSYG